MQETWSIEKTFGPFLHEHLAEPLCCSMVSRPVRHRSHSPHHIEPVFPFDAEGNHEQPQPPVLHLNLGSHCSTEAQEHRHARQPGESLVSLVFHS